jgi:hypothetical protein
MHQFAFLEPHGLSGKTEKRSPLTTCEHEGRIRAMVENLGNEMRRELPRRYYTVTVCMLTCGLLPVKRLSTRLSFNKVWRTP